MKTFIYSTALVASASLSFAAPANIKPRAAFEVKQEARGLKWKNGPMQVINTYQKFGVEAPSDVKAAAAAQQSGEVAAIPEQFDQAYISPVTVGNSKLNLDFDTGSADLWVFSTETPQSQSAGHDLYDVSTGTRLQGATWDISYGDGSTAGGIVYTDKVVVGGVTATSQAVEAAETVSGSFVDFQNSDGLLGLAFSSINQVSPQPQTTFFDTVSDTLAKALFTVDLKKGEAGSYTFGYIDSSKYSGAITYVPVDDSQGFWQFSAGQYSVGSNSTSSAKPLGVAIADTGTSLMYLSDAATTAYYNAVQGSKYDQSQGGYTVPCNADLPDFTLKIGGQSFTVPGNYINYAPIDNSGATCFGGIQSDAGIGFSILGDVFLKAFYAIFDNSGASPKFGLAAQAAA